MTGATVERSVLFTGARVETGSRIEESLLLPTCASGAIAASAAPSSTRGCVVPDGLVIGEDSASDQRLFHRSSEGIVLVTQEMLDNLQARGRGRHAAAGVPPETAPVRAPARARR